ncbi:MAG TPA: transcriptional regulator [Kiritimatiellia bacterium]|nr:transcriptional regulator [Kiritimatiellia bacterium]HPS09142.1 transcriptional regulator [Kiritimatiellia bacterium]
MTAKTNRFEALDRVFHEPNRMSILSVLCNAPAGLPFTELRDCCGLTDGNLNRHVKTLEEEGIVRCTKAFVNGKPRTTVALTASGSKRFQTYLDALTDVLKQAKAAMKAEKKPQTMRLSSLEATT